MILLNQTYNNKVIVTTLFFLITNWISEFLIEIAQVTSAENLTGCGVCALKQIDGCGSGQSSTISAASFEIANGVQVAKEGEVYLQRKSMEFSSSAFSGQIKKTAQNERAKLNRETDRGLPVSLSPLLLWRSSSPFCALPKRNLSAI